ncbi:hypothetical protein ACQP2U_24615 [Nocardia sp. CA-084685]|uniref:hypothetical protein n=1 Tax=Nocardia sp. CA-084685 TaxID=3239970 RepID=UPI003D9769E1
MTDRVTAQRDHNDVWRDKIQELIDHHRSLFDKAGRQIPYPVEPASDLQTDRDRVPDLWVDSVVQRQIAHSIDCAQGIRDLAEIGTHSFAHFVLIRGIFESSAMAVWLLESDDQKIRLGRLLAQHADHWREYKNAYDLTDIDVGTLYADRATGLKKMMQDAGLRPADCKFPGYTKLIKTVDDSPCTPTSLELAWRLCSGVAHGKTWATAAVTTEVEPGPTIVSGQYSGRMPDYQTVKTMLGTAFRTLSHADVLFEIRRTSRPHAIRSVLQPHPS